MAGESKLENECRDYVEHGLQGKIVKTTIVGQNGWPDRIMAIPQCPVVFIEFKDKGKKLRKNQDRWRRWLHNNGFEHWSIDDWDTFVRMVEELVEYGRTEEKRKRDGDLNSM